MLEVDSMVEVYYTVVLCCSWLSSVARERGWWRCYVVLTVAMVL